MNKDDFAVVPFEKLKNTKAWKLTSRYARLISRGMCYTCENKYPLDKLNAGHFREKRGGSATYFNLKNLRAQCFRCNKQLHGAKDIYAKKLVEEYGVGILDELFREGQKSKVWTKKELREIEQNIEDLIKKYERE